MMGKNQYFFVNDFPVAGHRQGIELTKRNGINISRRSALVLLSLSGLIWYSGVTQAAGVRNGVNAASGELVLMRSVPQRSAFRPGNPGRAVLLDAGPEEEVAEMLGGYGVVEINDIQAATIFTRPQPGSHRFHGKGLNGSAPVRQSTAGPANTLNRTSLSGSGLGVLGGTIRNSTSGIARHAQGSAGIVNSILGNQ